ncbi:MAG: hypothetical protein HZA48_05595 [Planctomycetes bacterium]|nr:hypothetical protein [Planctomycetota bacterium]
MKLIKIQKWNIALVVMVMALVIACIYGTEDAGQPKSGTVAGELKGVRTIYFSDDEGDFSKPSGKLGRYYAVSAPEEVNSIIESLDLTDTRQETGGYRTNGKIKNSILFVKSEGSYLQADFIDPNLRFYDNGGALISEFEISKKAVKAIRQYLTKN